MNVREIIKNLQADKVNKPFEAFDDGCNYEADLAIDRLKKLEEGIKLILTGEKEHSWAEQVLLNVLGKEEGK